MMSFSGDMKKKNKGAIMDEIAKKLPMSQVDRPDWDFNKLVETGFHKIQVEISGSPLPMSFCIVAQKG